MFGEYKAVLNYQLPKDALKTVLYDAADRYLALHQNVFPINRQDSSIEFKVQKSSLSRGEIVVISIENKAFCAVSRHIGESPQSIGGWIKNRHNIITLSTYVQDAVSELSELDATGVRCS
ncbi:MAG: hypothetical protein AAFO95_01880 [Cyanobacteria bacterium J06600_6]